MKKKILFIIWTYTMGGGAEALLTSIVNCLNPEKYEIDIIEYHHADIKTEPVNGNIHVLPFIESTHKWVRRVQYIGLYTFPQLVTSNHFRKQYDLYVAFNYLIPSFLLPKNTKNIQWIHESAYGLLARREAWNKRKQDKALDKANKIVVISNYTEKAVKELFPRHIEKMVKLYNGINIDMIRKKALENTDVRLVGPSVVFIGRLEEAKDPLRLIEVIRAVHEKGVRLHLYMLGKGEQKSLIMDKVNMYKLSNFVHVLGYQQNPFPIVKQCDVVCLLSKSEGFSMCLLESVALGKPFVSTNIGGANELLDGYECGYVIETDEEAVSAILSLLQKDKDKIVKECEKSINRFEFSSYIKSIENLMDEVISENGERK